MKVTYRYCESLTDYQRLRTREVQVGPVPMGGTHPVRIQSMTNTSTLDTAATVEQIKGIADAGADYARMTVRTLQEARNLEQIKHQLRGQGYHIPLIADVHFNPRIAETSAAIVEKVRINPGNYAIGDIKKADYQGVRAKFTELLNACKKHGTALRIGVNHGSLSQRIMDQYGDTPQGMTESALEFIRICREEDFHQVVISMKSSNTRVMVQANRLLAHRMLTENMVYPLHLGVTEAGEGEDGRIKSAVGIASLLNDGIGDTIRVSLTEAPEKEVPVARKLVHYATPARPAHLPTLNDIPINPFDYQKRRTQPVLSTGGESPPVVALKNSQGGNPPADLSFFDAHHQLPDQHKGMVIIPHDEWEKQGRPANPYPLFNSVEHYLRGAPPDHLAGFISTTIDEMEKTEKMRDRSNLVLLLRTTSSHPPAEQRRFIFGLMNRGIHLPVILHRIYQEDNPEDLQLRAASDTGLLFTDGLADGLLIENKGDITDQKILDLSYGILQASRSRIFKAEFISCPGCGRTQFNLERTVASIRQRMSHLKGLKIAVMGCIVNGPGEMADADYGYVGAAPGKITLYRNKQVVKRNIPEEKAVDELVNLIKAYGDWKEEWGNESMKQ